MDTIVCNNRFLMGLKPIIIAAFLLICFSCIFLPVVFYAFIVELKKKPFAIVRFYYLAYCPLVP